MNKGFISPITISIAGLLVILSTAGIYGVYKYIQVVEEKEQMEHFIAQQEEEELEELREKVRQYENESELESDTTESTTLTTFYIKPESANVRPCTDTASSDCVPIGQYKQNTEIQLQYTSIDNMPEWVSVKWEDSDAYINKIVLSERKVITSSEVSSTVTEESGASETVVDSDEETGLIISNVKTSEYGDSTNITWETNLKTDSRIIIDDDFFVSDFSDSTDHSVTFSDLPNDSVINYEIVAVSGSLESSKFGKFTTRLGELQARFAYSNDKDCIVVIIEDSNGSAQSNIPLRITSEWTLPDGTRFVNRYVIEHTTSWGEVEYCESSIENIEVKNNDTGDVYYDGILPLYW